MLNYSALPDLIALAALVLVFWSILHRRVGHHLDAWLLGWTFLLLHFAAQFLDVGNDVWENATFMVSLLALELAGFAFIRAASRYDYFMQHRYYFLGAVAGLLSYTVLACWNVQWKPPYYGAIAVMAVCTGALNYYALPARSSRDRILSFLMSLALVLVLAVQTYRNQTWYGIDTSLTWLYLVCGIRYWQRFQRKTTGVLVATGGFLAWAAVFPLGRLQDIYAPTWHVQGEVWNIPKYIVVVGILLTFLEEQMERAEHLSLHDALTGLPNRRLFEDRLEKTLERADRNRTRAAVLLLDLDGFKQINDAHGHAAGDAFLRAAALRLQSKVRKADTIARTGGDEFTIIVSDMNEAQDAETLARKLQREMEMPITVGALQLQVKGSIGIAVYPDDAQTADDLCALADAAMYEVKRGVKPAPSSHSAAPNTAAIAEN
jgi:diguanylate cyclase (GGDEF)-like protein